MRIFNGYSFTFKLTFKRIVFPACCVLISWLIPYDGQAENTDHIVLNARQQQQLGIQTEVVNVFSKGGGGTQQHDGGMHVSGTVVAPANAISVVSSLVTGTVQHVYVNSLQQIKAGATIATLFSQPSMEMQKEYIQLSTQASLARQKAARDEALYKDGLIAISRLQESKGSALQAQVAATERYQTLQASGLSSSAIRTLSRANRVSPHLTVTAHDSGTLLDVTIQSGQKIEAGMPIARILRPNKPLWIEFQVPRQTADQMHVGDFLSLKQCGTVKVIAVSPQVESTNQNTLVRAEYTAQDGCLKLNQFVEASHSASAVEGSLAVPSSAIVRSGAQRLVFVQQPSGFKVVRVKVLSTTPDKTWVQGSITAGQRVAVRGLIALKGKWMGLGAEESSAEVPATPTNAKGNH